MLEEAEDKLKRERDEMENKMQSEYEKKFKNLMGL